jgi:hypothetical protein
MQTPKKIEEDSENKTVSSRLCRVNLKLEATLYSLFIFILYIPALVVSAAIKTAKWLKAHIPSVIIWIIRSLILPALSILWNAIKIILKTIFGGLWNAVKWVWSILVKVAKWLGTTIPLAVKWIIQTLILPVFSILWTVIFAILKVAFVILKTVVIGLWNAVKWILHIIVYSFSIINWCAVRSITRLISIVCGIGSLGYIIYELTRVVPDHIFTGYFYDANPEVQMTHYAIVLLMLSIVFYYHAWAYSKKEEMRFVCRNTWHGKKIHEMLSNIWK